MHVCIYIYIGCTQRMQVTYGVTKTGLLITRPEHHCVFPRNCHMLAYIQNFVVFKVDSKVAVKSYVAKLPCEIFAMACCFAIEPCMNWHISYFLRVEEGTLSRTVAFDWDADMLKKSML